jgi:hypothetical protein
VEVVRNNVTRRPAFDVVAGQIAQLKPSSTGIVEYTPTRTTPACSSVSTSIRTYPNNNSTSSNTVYTLLRLATALPPKPDPTLCGCMINSLRCVYNGESVSNSEVPNWKDISWTRNQTQEDRITNACSRNETWCFGSTGNTTIGRYGAYSVCTSTERTSWVLNQLYKARQYSPDACTTEGGVITIPTKNQTKQCQSLMQQAGADGSGVILRTQLPESSVLSPSAKAGIGVGVGTLLLCALALLVLVLVRRLGRQTSNDNTDSFTKAELPDSQLSRPENTVPEIDGNNLTEIGTTGVIMELENNNLAELPTIYNEPVELDTMIKIDTPPLPKRNPRSVNIWEEVVLRNY